LVLALGIAADDATAGPDDVYVRGLTSIDQAVSRLEQLCENRGSKEAVVVFDWATFDPPKGWSAFREEYTYRRDLDAWIAAIEKWAKSSKRKIRVATSTSKKPWAVRGKWDKSLREELPEEKDRAKQRPLRVAHKWMERLVRKLKSGSALILVTGELFPEQSVTAKWSSFNAKSFGGRASSNSGLFSPGEYWLSDEIDAVLRKRRVVFHVVAPEARFGGFTPFDDLPQMPWVARPTVGEIGTKRFVGALMNARRGTRAFNTECPSGYGVWKYARAAAATNGKYLLYPFPKGEGWLDACLFDPAKRKALAPELVSPTEYLQLCAADPVGTALLEAVRIVQPETPWRAGGWQGPEKLSWLAFESLDPPRMSSDYDPAVRPEAWTGVSPKECKKKWGSENPYLAAQSHYDRAIRGLITLRDAIDSGARVDVRPRSAANLRLSIFWLEMMAFHLRVQGLELERLQGLLGPRVKLGKDERFSHSFRTVLRLSDCLEPLPGLKKEAVKRGQLPFRALRPGSRVLDGFGPELRPSVDRVVAAAKAVMAHDRETPWGWMVYYSELVVQKISVHQVGKPKSRARKRPKSGSKGATTPRVKPPPVVKPGAGSIAPSSGG